MVSLYSALFSSGMKTKWSRRIYLELYAGAGYSKIRETSEIIFGSPFGSSKPNTHSTNMFSAKKDLPT